MASTSSNPKMPVRRSIKRSASMNLGRTKKPRISIVPTNIPTSSTGIPGIVLTLGMGDVGQLGLGVDVQQKNKPAIITDIKEDIENICAGGMHTICVTSDGKVITFGCNDEGALGRETTDEEGEHTPGFVELEGKVVQVSAGDSHSAALLANGKVFAWGSFRDSSGSMGLTGVGIQKLPIEMLPGERIVKIASGADHLVMLTASGHLFTCGCGEQGQLGRVSSRAAGRDSRQGLSQLLTPAEVPLNPRVKKVTDIWAAPYATFAKSQDDIYVFGLNNYAQLGLGDTENRFHIVKAKAFNGRSWTQICGGQHHTIARDDNGIAYALGRFEYGRLGLGAADPKDATQLTVIPALEAKKCVDVACGSAVSLAVTDEGKVYGWGMGTNAQLGNGDVEDDIYEPQLVGGKQLETRKAHRVSAGGQHTVILASK